jgi:E3 ubiquitin-protein ligase Topors
MIVCYRNHPEEIHRLIPWLNRELQAILQNPGLAARVLDLVISQLPHHHIQSREFRSQLETYLREHYNHFIHEFYVFARSPYDMIGFDENAHYSGFNNGWVCVHVLHMNFCVVYCDYQ